MITKFAKTTTDSEANKLCYTVLGKINQEERPERRSVLGQEGSVFSSVFHSALPSHTIQ